MPAVGEIKAGRVRASSQHFALSNPANQGWIIAQGDGYSFDIVQEHGGIFPTRRAALETLLVHLEADRRELNRAIARAKRWRRRTPAVSQ